MCHVICTTSMWTHYLQPLLLLPVSLGHLHDLGFDEAMTHCAGASPTATYEGFTPDRIFRSPTDLNWVIGRVLVLNDTDLATAYNFSKAYAVSPYDPAGMPAKHTAPSPTSLLGML